MKIRLALIALLLITFVLGAHADVPGYRIATPGSHHGEEVFAKDGEKWWGLFQTDEKGWELQPVTLRVTPEVDQVGDDDPKNPTGRKVLAEGERQPFLLIDGLKNPIAGPVAGAISRDFVVPDKPVDFEFSNIFSGQLRAVGKPTEVPSQGLCYCPYDLTFESRGESDFDVKQVVLSRKCAGGDGRPMLLWSGDLDRDGRIDLLLDILEDYNEQHLALYISSERKLGDLVRLVARYRTTGC